MESLSWIFFAQNRYVYLKRMGNGMICHSQRMVELLNAEIDAR